MRPVFRTRKRIALGALALAILVAGGAMAVETAGGSTPAAADEILPAFNDCDALTARMRELALPYVGDRGLNGEPVLDQGDDGTFAERELDEFEPIPQAKTTKAAKSAAKTSSTAGRADRLQPGAKLDPVSASSSNSLISGDSPDDAVGTSATGTNIQETGVDEPDIAKTDGRLVISLDGGSLRIVDVSTDKPRSRGSLDLRSLGLAPSELLLDDDRVLVLGTTTRADGQDDYYYYGKGRVYGATVQKAALGLIDISHPDKPRLLATEEITGRHVSARLSGGAARIVISSTPNLPFLTPGTNRSGNDAARNYNSDVVKFAKAQDWLPSRTVIDGAGHILRPAGPLVDCADVRYPAQDSGLDMLSVVTIDLGRDDAFSAAHSLSVVAAGDLVYASPERLYVATTQGGWGRSRTFGGRDSGVTSVHEFDISEPAVTDYLSSGKLDGYIPGRWAMDEYAGYLRVVTTTQEPWLNAGGTESHVVVLQPRRNRLVQVGGVGGLGHGETVRAVRWFDELAAVVTFRQTDPLYLVDMKVPDRPLVRGKLKIPGYSAYLHPIGDHRLLGVGQDADSRGSEKGLQVSSFDVADAADPRRLDAVGYGLGSRSVVQDDPRGFVYLPERHTAILPAEIPFDGGGCDSGVRCYPGSATGLIAVRVAKDGDLVKNGSWRLEAPSNDAEYAAWRSARADKQVTKVLSLPGGRLAALDGDGVTILDADTLEGRGSAKYGSTK